ncbi:MAG: site-2 protease family protein [Candidatus Dadabacteria bacterium]|nr:MAG: site-2 protease family protein [Candidatus Dadabacteria bacterium]
MDLDRIVVQVLPILLAVTLHEYAHGWVARRLGDRTAELNGRLTVNPLAHVDPIGTVVFPLLQLLFPPHRVFFGWARPVPIDPRNFEHPLRGMMWVALGGPAANLLQLLVCAGLVHLMMAIDPMLPVAIQSAPTSVGQQIMVPLLLMAVYGVQINAVLMAFNLIPIPPLDGSRVAYALLPPSAARRLMSLERYGLLIIFGLLVFAPGALHLFVEPVVNVALALAGLR